MQVTTNRKLRLLLQTARISAGLTQAEAARRAGIDPSWWKKLESGRRTRTQSETISMMAHAVGINPDQLDGYSDVRERLELLSAGAITSLDGTETEAYLAMVPGTTTWERDQLIKCFRSLRQPKHDPDPYAEKLRSQLRRNRRSLNDRAGPDPSKRAGGRDHH